MAPHLFNKLKEEIDEQELSDLLHLLGCVTGRWEGCEEGELLLEIELLPLDHLSIQVLTVILELLHHHAPRFLLLRTGECLDQVIVDDTEFVPTLGCWLAHLCLVGR
jgi:hypothetical protein